MSICHIPNLPQEVFKQPGKHHSRCRQAIAAQQQLWVQQQDQQQQQLIAAAAFL